MCFTILSGGSKIVSHREVLNKTIVFPQGKKFTEAERDLNENAIDYTT